jgi:3-phosphoshikimate 1-carboxyvinyltransferase
MTSYIVKPADKPLLGHVKVPGDKSIAHRALLFGGLCQGAVAVHGVSAGADNGRSARAMAALGVTMERRGDALVIRGVGLRGLRAPEDAPGHVTGHVIDCGNSGTTIRLLCGLLAGQAFATTLAGDQSLSGRPMRRVIDPLSRMGAVITGQDGARAGEIYPPLRVHGVAPGGALRAIDYALPMASAQVKSAILLAGLYAEGTTIVREPGPSRDHTERMLARMGAPVRRPAPGVPGAVELDTSGWDGRLAADRVVVPGDPSQAAFVIAAGLIAGVERITVADVCINPTRTGFLDVLADMGALIEREAMSPARDNDDEPRADLSISRPINRAGGRSGARAGQELAATIIAGELTVRSIDELPILAVVAARAAGVTEIRDAGELRVKESDRIATTCDMLRALGVEVEERAEGLLIHGQPERRFTSARVHARGDHRIAMSAAVAGLAAEGPVRVDGVECVATSFPDFAEVLRALGADIAIEA